MAKPKVQPQVTILEDRTTPAGNVTAFVGGGVLNILGDDVGNLIKVDRLGRQSVMIRAMDSTTTINGQSTPQWFGDIANGFDIKMGGGDDAVEINKVDSRWLDIDMGDGNDTLDLISSRITRHTTILGGAGDDDLRAFNTTFKRRTTIDAGEGNDRLSLEQNQVEKNAYVEGGAGTNTGVFFQTNLPGGSPITNFSIPYTTSVGPRAIIDEASVQQGKSVTINVAANDQGNGNTLNLASVTISSNPSKGHVQNNGNGTITYTSNGTDGGDTFTYTIADSKGTVSNKAIVSVDVTGDPNVSDNPSVTLTSNENSPTLAGIIPITAVFSEAVNGFSVADLVVTNGTVSGFTIVNSRTFTFSVTPTADGVVSVNIPAGSATDAAGNPNLVGNFSITSLRTDDGMVDTAPSASDPNFVKDSNNIGIWDTRVGTGATVAAGDNIRVFYTGWLTDGTKFDSSRTAGSPAAFDLDGLISGWKKAVPGMKVGGIRRLLIPPEEGYGSQGSNNIPPNSTLIFEIKIVGIG
jgi:FKBP-type peptidyl-prolyl cis-trans isomerase/Bacterial Ig-like domain/Bacterial Ig domain